MPPWDTFDLPTADPEETDQLKQLSTLCPPRLRPPTLSDFAQSYIEPNTKVSAIMSSSPPERSCPLLYHLPAELRLQIYAHLVSFTRPLKLRQVIPGSRDLAILRTNRQIHAEALGVLYELNTIVVTRNDFCPHTDPSLRTPLHSDQARRLFISSFSISIACTLRGKGNRCPVCQPSAEGLFDALRAMPKLRATTIDFTKHSAEFSLLTRATRGILDTAEGACSDGGMVAALKGEAVRRLDVSVVVL